MNRLTKLPIALSILAATLLMTACGVFRMETTAERVDLSASTTPVATPEVITTEMEPASSTATPEPVLQSTVIQSTDEPFALDVTYVDEIAGLALDYPSFWHILQPDATEQASAEAYTITFQSWQSGPSSGDGVPEDGTRVDLFVRRQAADTLENAINSLRSELTQQGAETAILSEERVTLASGVEAVRLRTESQFGESTETVTSINGNLVRMGGVGNPAFIDLIVQSLRGVGGTERAFEPYPVQMTDVVAIRVVSDSDSTPVYSGPSNTFTQAAAIPSGLAVSVSGISPDGNWYQLTGCREQNPNRPAPSCWITTNPGVSEPIPALVPSGATVLETETEAIFISPNTAPVHGGPDAAYPVVSQLFGGFPLAISGISENGEWWRLRECSSPLNMSLAECWISADPAVTEPAAGLIIPDPPADQQASENSPLRTGTMTLTGLPQCFNLDTGRTGAPANPNCEFTLYPQDSPGTLVFEPVPPARFGFGGVFPSAPTAADCASSQHLSSSTEVIAPMATFYVCYQTGEGRFGYLHFEEMTDNPLAVVLSWETFE